MSEPAGNEAYRYLFRIPQDAIDGNGHVNNVMYVQWMQDAAIRHFDSLGGAGLMSAAHATWVVRSHKIEYLSPAFAGEEIEVRTWISQIRRVRVHRRYEFIRCSDGKVIAQGETDWIYVHLATGKPLSIPPDILKPLKENERAWEIR